MKTQNTNNPNTNISHNITVPRILEIKDIITIATGIVVATSAWWAFSTRIAVLEYNLMNVVSESQHQSSNISELQQSARRFELEMQKSTMYITDLKEKVHAHQGIGHYNVNRAHQHKYKDVGDKSYRDRGANTKDNP